VGDPRYGYLLHASRRLSGEPNPGELGHFGDQEEGGFEVTHFEQVEQPRRVLGARTIVKCHSQEGALNPHVSINPVGRSSNVGSLRGRFALVLSPGAVARAKERDAKKEKIAHRN
jgi:hypothetical protein